MRHTKTSYKLISLALCLTMLLPLAGCGESKQEQAEIFAMDTYMTLTAYGKNATAGLNAAKSVITSMDSMLDPELETSTTYAINHAEGASVVVPGQVARMLNTAQTIYKQSGGALDLTIYPLIKRWGFVDGKYYVPTDEEISSDLAKRCFDKLTLTSFPSSGTYMVQMPSGGELSFASVAKGCASDNAIEAMRQAGVESGIISLGGNVQTLGLKPDGSKWTVAIQDPNNLQLRRRHQRRRDGGHHERQLSAELHRHARQVLPPHPQALDRLPRDEFARLRDDNLHGRRNGGLPFHGDVRAGRDRGAELLAHLRRL